jgi:peptide/nickel transport system ATP-binding protein
MSCLLSVTNLGVKFGQVTAVEGVSFELRRGGALGIVGESGSGKSVTCRALMRLLAPGASISGSISFDGTDLATLPNLELDALRGRRMGMIFQSPASHLDPLMRIGDQVGQTLRCHRNLTGRALRDEVLHLLDRMRIPDPGRWARAYPHQLSGGMKQRAMIAGALACGPDLLIADEPTTALDATVQKEILDLLVRLRREQGLSMIFVSHDLGAVAQVCDDMVVMQAGRIVEAGTTEQIIRAPRHDYTHRLVSAHPDRLPPRPARKLSTANEPLLAVQKLRVRYGGRSMMDVLARREGGFTAVHDVDLEVKAGEALGIVGESGSGKSTLARTLVGLNRPDRGEICYDGRRSDPSGADRRTYLRGVQLVYQHPYEALSPRLTAFQSIAEPLGRHRIVPPERISLRVAELMREVDLSPDLGQRRPAQLSGGQCQRVAIARALALEPRVLIADEVTSALDVTLQAQVLDLLIRLQSERGLTMIFISHDLGVIRRLCDHVIVMRAGRIVEAGPTTRVFDAPAEPYTRELLAAIPRLPLPDAVPL